MPPQDTMRVGLPSLGETIGLALKVLLEQQEKCAAVFPVVAHLSWETTSVTGSPFVRSPSTCSWSTLHPWEYWIWAAMVPQPSWCWYPPEAPRGTKTCPHLDFELPATGLQCEAPLPTPRSVVPGNTEAGGHMAAQRMSCTWPPRSPARARSQVRGLVSPSCPGLPDCSVEPGPDACTPLVSGP